MQCKQWQRSQFFWLKVKKEQLFIPPLMIIAWMSSLHIFLTTLIFAWVDGQDTAFTQLFFPIRLDQTMNITQVVAFRQKCWGCCTDERGRDQSYSFCLRSFASCLIGNENNIEFFSKFCQTCPLLQNGVCVIDWQIILWQILAASSTRSSVAFVARGVMVSNPLQLGVLAAPVIFCFKSSKS